MGISACPYVYDNEDNEHLSDHVYDDLASSVFHLFADIKRKLVGKNGIYTLDTGIWRNGAWGCGSNRQEDQKPEMYDFDRQIWVGYTTSVLDVLSIGSYRIKAKHGPCVLRSDMTVSLAQGRTL